MLLNIILEKELTIVFVTSTLVFIYMNTSYTIVTF